MEPDSPWSSERLHSNRNEQDGGQKQPVVGYLPNTKKIYKNFIAALDTIKIANIRNEVVTMDTSNNSGTKKITEDKLTNIDARDQGTVEKPNADIDSAAEQSNSLPERGSLPFDDSVPSIDMFDTGKLALPENSHSERVSLGCGRSRKRYYPY